jgi:hypothetical protein
MLDAGAATPGLYGYYVPPMVLTKADDAANLCLRIYIMAGVGPAYGVNPLHGFGIQKVELTNSAADCTSVNPTGEVVEAFCGSGTFTSILSCPPGCPPLAYGAGLDATFEFPPTFPWVPATDTFDAVVSQGFDCPC